MSANNSFKQCRDVGVIAPGRSLFTITPADGSELAHVPRSIYVGAGGNITLIGADDTIPVLLTSVPTGAVLPLQARIIQETGTTASNLVGIY